jgi:F-type H+-transporting ATPase subunit epsilon
MASLKFKIITPERVVYENDIAQVTLPTTSGEITILPGHMPLISILSAGEMRIVDANGEQPIAVASGCIEVRPNNDIIILADNAERAEEIDIARAEEARQRAEEQMKQIVSVQDVDFARLEAVMERELNRVRVGKKYRKLP